MSVRSILKSKGHHVVTAKTTTPIDEVLGILSREKIGAVIISDDGFSVSGILSERDIVRGLNRHGASLLDCRAGQLMTHPVTEARIDMPLLHVLELMTKGRFRHMPVVDNGKLIGLISIGDAVKARLDLLEAEAHALKAYIAQV